jgi:hypothetical protein
MASSEKNTFIIDCHICKAKVAAVEDGRSACNGYIEEAGEPWGERVLVGSCPRCKTILVGHSSQLRFEGYDADEDVWSDFSRVFPKPSKAFSSYRIPRTVTDSLVEADRSLQANANIAACVMFGRALEALCRDILEEPIKAHDAKTGSKQKRFMLGAGLKQLREKKVIDDRLYDWSQQLAAFRNLAAHPEDISISRDDAEDLQTFVYAIVEYVYDLADRYDEFKERAEKRARRRKS